MKQLASKNKPAQDLIQLRLEGLKLRLEGRDTASLYLQQLVRLPRHVAPEQSVPQDEAGMG